MSLPEILLWQRLKGTPHGVAFRKQHPIGPYRADFYCAAAGLVIEVDGVSHDMGDRPVRDAKRDQYLLAKGYRIVRMPAADVLRDPEGAADSILQLARSSPARGGGPHAQRVVEGGVPRSRLTDPERPDTPLHRPGGTVPLPASGEDRDG